MKVFINGLNNLKKNKIMEQTAVEWLLENAHIIPKNELNKREVIQQAKEMEKQQIIDAYGDGLNAHRTDFCNREEYYQLKFKNK